MVAGFANAISIHSAALPRVGHQSKYDDTGHGSVRVPATWRLLYKDGTGWKPVEAVESYGVARDRFNRVSFQPVTTGALRIEVTMQPTFSAGLQEWTVK